MNSIDIWKSLLGGLAWAGLVATPLVSQTHPDSPGADGVSAAKFQHGNAEPLAPRGPIGAIHAHVCGFHFYSGDLKRALRVHHYCSHLNRDVLQCVIYDSDQPDARLIGIEYIISGELFRQLPAEEKKLWHSHRYEVMSGQLTAPDLSAVEEKALMQELVGTYGKTWHLWQVDRGDRVPLGLPKLMMGFTADDQADPSMIAARDRAQGIDPAKLKASRADLAIPPIADGADAWQKGQAFQISDELLKTPQVVPQP
ncbi:MAG: OBAP family protein [Candidatus Didemnitutus sp.]|nr:OBAP family protein [Candidatus Didemnitutus sp.]